MGARIAHGWSSERGIAREVANERRPHQEPVGIVKSGSVFVQVGAADLAAARRHKPRRTFTLRFSAGIREKPDIAEDI